jgi:hypothetical protein
MIANFVTMIWMGREIEATACAFRTSRLQQDDNIAGTA